MAVKRRKQKKVSRENTYKGRESPEDIMADSQLIFVNKQPTWKSKAFLFTIGLLIGVIALYAASTTPTAQTHLNEFHDYLALQLADMDIANILPANVRMDELIGNFSHYVTPTFPVDELFMPAADYKEALDLKPHYPVVMIPGIVSSGLESWGTSDKSKKYFRKRMWGTMAMVRAVILDKESWTDHIMLDSVTGLDPPDYKIRAVHGLDAADYFITGYWIWAKIIENLATIGYDTNNMYFASYDWRLSFSNLEVRDKYYSHLKSTIELYKQTTGLKSVVLGHSMGSSVFTYFLKWVESEKGGKGGSDWVDNHIESFVNIAGPMMGVPKAITSLLSGETRDTMAFGSFGAYVLEKFFSRKERTRLMRSWFGAASMLPKGGNVIWGVEERAPDDDKDEKFNSFGNLITFVPIPTEDSSNTSDALQSLPLNYTAEESFQLLLENADENFNKQIFANYSFGIANKKELKANENDPTKWANPLEYALPKAPKMSIYCFYGTNLPTERSYYYTLSGNSVEAKCRNKNSQEESDQSECLGNRSDMYIDASVNDPIRRVETGIRFSNGDGTVPLLSLGYMCTPSGGWTKYADRYNPSNIPVVLREYENGANTNKLDIRGGSKTGDHIDILGNWDMTLDILQIVSGKGDNVTQRIYSSIEDYAQKIDLP
ncbi:Lecithin:cholesterol acyltransferase-domain-containing protein [Pilobolus umbonatus]|nr:Lecithin:cholesterol acyltransferase-domain-containing protein [Pilobolus umbonatus]